MILLCSYSARVRLSIDLSPNMSSQFACLPLERDALPPISTPRSPFLVKKWFAASSTRATRGKVNPSSAPGTDTFALLLKYPAHTPAVLHQYESVKPEAWCECRTPFPAVSTYRPLRTQVLPTSHQPGPSPTASITVKKKPAIFRLARLAYPEGVSRRLVSECTVPILFIPQEFLGAWFLKVPN